MYAHQSRDTLANLSTGLLTVHIWLATGYAWYLVMQTGFFGAGIGGRLVAALALVFLLMFGTAFVQLLLRMIVRQALEKPWISGAGCMTGIALFIGMGALFVWSLTRDLNLAWWAFLLAPPTGLVAALAVTFFAPLLRRLGWPP